MVAGRPHRVFEAMIGDRIIVGNTLLVVLSDAAVPPGPSLDVDIRTLLTGVGADALAMGSLYELIEALDTAKDQASLTSALGAWSSQQVPSVRVDVRLGSSAGSRIPEHAEEDATVVLVPAPSDDPISLAFLVESAKATLTDSFRRMLVVAGRLFGSSLSRLRRAEVDAGELATLRALSFGARP